MIGQVVQRLGATQLGVWAIKHLIAPLDRWLYLRTSGRRVALGKLLAPNWSSTGRIWWHSGLLINTTTPKVVSGASLSWNRLDKTASQITTPKQGR